MPNLTRENFIDRPFVVLSFLHCGLTFSFEVVVIVVVSIQIGSMVPCVVSVAAFTSSFQIGSVIELFFLYEAQ